MPWLCLGNADKRSICLDIHSNKPPLEDKTILAIPMTTSWHMPMHRWITDRDFVEHYKQTHGDLSTLLLVTNTGMHRKCLKFIRKFSGMAQPPEWFVQSSPRGIWVCCTLHTSM